MITINLSPVKYDMLVLLLNVLKKDNERFKAIQNACDEVLEDIGHEVTPDSLGAKSKRVKEKKEIV